VAATSARIGFVMEPMRPVTSVRTIADRLIRPQLSRTQKKSDLDNRGRSLKVKNPTHPCAEPSGRTPALRKLRHNCL
jgi:hypothetical protein